MDGWMAEVATVASGRQHWQLRGSFEMLGMQEEQKGNRKFEISCRDGLMAMTLDAASKVVEINEIDHWESTPGVVPAFRRQAQQVAAQVAGASII